jgi:hypothetical protein
MTWIVGVDEAGYGPNLGPLVMSSAACYLPDELASQSLWKLLNTAVRRRRGADDQRILVDDSKLVYSSTCGLAALERGIAAILPVWPRADRFKFHQLLEFVTPDHAVSTAIDPWFTGTTVLPVELDVAEQAAAVSRFERACAKRQVAWGLFRSVIVHASEFNLLLARWGSKGAVLGHALNDILRANLALGDTSEPLWFFIDKHGGRNGYSALVQDAIPEGFVVAEKEGMLQSRYRVLGLGREVRLTFEPRADGKHFCVALASMLSKYLREIFMIEFNHYWQGHVPGLQATAGYPGDAARFFRAMRPALAKLAIAEESVWRKR